MDKERNMANSFIWEAIRLICASAAYILYITSNLLKNNSFIVSMKLFWNK